MATPAEKKKKTSKATAVKKTVRKAVPKKKQPTAKEKALKAERDQVQSALIEALKAKGADTALYRDQIEKYIDLWDMYALLAEDVRVNGLRYPTESPSGATVIKDNPSVKNLAGVNKQMLMQLKMLDLLDFKSMALPEEEEEL